MRRRPITRRRVLNIIRDYGLDPKLFIVTYGDKVIRVDSLDRIGWSGITKFEILNKVTRLVYKGYYEGTERLPNGRLVYNEGPEIAMEDKVIVQGD